MFEIASTILTGSKNYLSLSIDNCSYFSQNKVPWGPLEGAWFHHSTRECDCCFKKDLKICKSINWGGSDLIWNKCGWWHSLKAELLMMHHRGGSYFFEGFFRHREWGLLCSTMQYTWLENVEGPYLARFQFQCPLEAFDYFKPEKQHPQDAWAVVVGNLQCNVRAQKNGSQMSLCRAIYCQRVGGKGNWPYVSKCDLRWMISALMTNSF